MSSRPRMAHADYALRHDSGVDILLTLGGWRESQMFGIFWISGRGLREILIVKQIYVCARSSNAGASGRRDAWSPHLPGAGARS